MHGIDFTVSKDDAVEDMHTRGTFKKKRNLFILWRRIHEKYSLFLIRDMEIK